MLRNDTVVTEVHTILGGCYTAVHILSYILPTAEPQSFAHILHASSIGMFMVYLHIKFQIPSSTDKLITGEKQSQVTAAKLLSKMP